MVFTNCAKMAIFMLVLTFSVLCSSSNMVAHVNEPWEVKGLVQPELVYASAELVNQLEEERLTKTVSDSSSEVLDGTEDDVNGVMEVNGEVVELPSDSVMEVMYCGSDLLCHLAGANISSVSKEKFGVLHLWLVYEDHIVRVCNYVEHAGVDVVLYYRGAEMSCD